MVFGMVPGAVALHTIAADELPDPNDNAVTATAAAMELINLRLIMMRVPQDRWSAKWCATISMSLVFPQSENNVQATSRLRPRGYLAAKNCDRKKKSTRNLFNAARMISVQSGDCLHNAIIPDGVIPLETDGPCDAFAPSRETRQ